MSFNPEIVEKTSQLHNNPLYEDFNNKLKELNQAIEYLKESELEGQDRMFQEDSIREIKEEILTKYGGELSRQMDSFFRGPKGTDDQSMYNWISENYIAAKLFTSQDFIHLCPLESLEKTEDELHAAAQMVNLFFANFSPLDNYWGDATYLDKQPGEAKYREYQQQNLGKLKTAYKAYAQKQNDKKAPFASIQSEIANDEYKEENKINKKNKKNEHYEEMEPKDDIDSVKTDSAPIPSVSSKKEQVKEKAAENEIPGLNLPPYGRDDFYRTDKDRLDRHLEDLVSAKTSVNSGEYKDLIKTIQDLNKKEDGPWMKKAGDLSKKENHIAKLLSIKMLINKYLQHKADDGVKKNTYQKLAAVESLNAFVSKRLEELKPEKYPKDSLFEKLNKTIDSLDERIHSHIMTDGYDENAMFRASDTDAAECRNAMSCMDRIIEKAKPAAQTRLIEMQTQFRDYPGKQELSEYAAPDEIKQAAQDAEDAAVLAERDYEKLSTSLQRAGWNFTEQDKLCYLFARENNLTVKVFHGKKDGTISIGTTRLSQEMITCADKAEDEFNVYEFKTDNSDYWDNAVKNDMDAISKAVKAQLPDFLDKMKSQIKNEKDLVKAWPKLDLAMQCYESLKGKQNDKSNIIRDFRTKMEHSVNFAERKGLHKVQTKNKGFSHGMS